MQDELNDSNRDTSEGNKSEMDTGVVEHLATFMCDLNLDYRHKLHTIMEKENHAVFSDTIKMLIDLEYDRIQESDHANV